MKKDIDPVFLEIINKQAATAAIICDQVAGSETASREQLTLTHNSITNNSSTNPAAAATRDCAGLKATSSSSGREVPGVIGDNCSAPAGSETAQISGIAIQLKQATETGRQTVYISLQLHNQLGNKTTQPDFFRWTAYLLPRSRGREFKCWNDLDRELYELTKEKQYKHWLIGHITERASKQPVEGITVTMDKEENSLILWFDHQECIKINYSTDAVSQRQREAKFTAAGTWGNDIKFPNTRAHWTKSSSTYANRKVVQDDE